MFADTAFTGGTVVATVTDREETLRELVTELTASSAIDDAFLAKSFTDRLLIVDVAGNSGLPAALTDRLADNDLHPAEVVYENWSSPPAGQGDTVGRYHFVDVRTRGTHRSYVVD